MGLLIIKERTNNFLGENKMKKNVVIILSVFAVLLFAGCASTNKIKYGESASQMAKKLGAPDWYFKSGLVDDAGIYAVGRSDLTDVLMAEKAARIDGRAALAQMIESAVSYAAENSLEYDSESRKYFKEQTQVISNQILVGSKQVDRFDMNGVVSVLMQQPFDDLIKKFKSAALKQDDERLKKILTDLTVEQFKEILENSSIE